MTEKIKMAKFIYLSTEKNMQKNQAILYNWKTAHRMEAGFSLKNRPRRFENTPG